MLDDTPTSTHAVRPRLRSGGSSTGWWLGHDGDVVGLKSDIESGIDARAPGPGDHTLSTLVTLCSSPLALRTTLLGVDAHGVVGVSETEALIMR